MRWKMRIRLAGSTDDGWWEGQDTANPVHNRLQRNIGWTGDDPGSLEDAKRFSESIVAWFNRTLREHEAARELCEVVIEDASEGERQHEWEKMNLFALRRGRCLYDRYRCKRCGITGKRLGLSDHITRDSDYRAKRHDQCRAAPAGQDGTEVKL